MKIIEPKTSRKLKNPNVYRVTECCGGLFRIAQNTAVTRWCEICGDVSHSAKYVELTKKDDLIKLFQEGLWSEYKKNIESAILDEQQELLNKGRK